MFDCIYYIYIFTALTYALLGNNHIVVISVKIGEMLEQTVLSTYFSSYMTLLKLLLL